MKPLSLIILGLVLLISGITLHLSAEKISEIVVNDTGRPESVSIPSRKDTALYFGDKITFIGIGILFIGIFVSSDRKKHGDEK